MLVRVEERAEYRKAHDQKSVILGARPLCRPHRGTGARVIQESATLTISPAQMIGKTMSDKVNRHFAELILHEGPSQERFLCKADAALELLRIVHCSQKQLLRSAFHDALNDRYFENSTRFQFFECLGNVRLRDDGITLKHAPCAPAANSHDHAFGDSGAAQVARGGATQIVEEQTGNACGFRSLIQCVAFTCFITCSKVNADRW
jgi:hypothetical protein